MGKLLRARWEQGLTSFHQCFINVNRKRTTTRKIDKTKGNARDWCSRRHGHLVQYCGVSNFSVTPPVSSSNTLRSTLRSITAWPRRVISRSFTTAVTNEPESLNMWMRSRVRRNQRGRDRSCRSWMASTGHRPVFARSLPPTPHRLRPPPPPRTVTQQMFAFHANVTSVMCVPLSCTPSLPW